jgi:hypothetical protein
LEGSGWGKTIFFSFFYCHANGAKQTINIW